MSATHPTHDVEQLAGTRWRLDASASGAEFRVPHFWGLATVTGLFGRLDGWLEVDEHGRWRMELTLDAASLNTGNRKRDEHLRSSEFFDAERHPVVRFRSSSASYQGGGRLHVDGALEAAGERAPLEVKTTVAQADAELEIDAAATVDQRRLGMTWSPLGLARTPTALTVHAHLRREH